MISTRYKVTHRQRPAAACLFGLLVLLVAACTTDDTATRQQSGLTPIAVSVADIGGQTRASGAGSHLDGTYNETQFNDGTLVDLFIGSDLVTATGSYTAGSPIYLKTANVGTTRLFDWYSNADRTAAMTAYWPASGTLDFYACYPTGAATSSTTGTITVATDQSTAAGIANSDLLLARAEGVAATPHAVPLQFEHQLSKVVVHLTADDADLADMLCHATITLGSVYTQATFNPTTDAVNTNTSGLTDNITLKFPTDVLTKSGSGPYTFDKDVYCIIPPQQLSGKTLTITPDASTSNNPYGFETLGYTIAYSGGTLTTQSAQVYTINVNASSAIPTVPVASITPWGTKDVEATTDYLRYMPLTLEATTANSVLQFAAGYEYRRCLSGTWTDWTATADLTDIDLPAIGDKVQFRSNGSSAYPGSATESLCKTIYGKSGTASQFKVYGNVMSLVNKDNFASQTTMTGTHNFNHLFDGVTNQNAIVDASGLILPATTLTVNCYQSMFQNCKGLISAPVLSATTLAEHCYSSMFKDCTSLTAAPVLPASTLANYCYQNMFNGCTLLSSIRCDATNISATDCTTDWVTGVAATGSFTGKSAAGWTTGNNGIPSGWTQHME